MALIRRFGVGILLLTLTGCIPGNAGADPPRPTKANVAVSHTVPSASGTAPCTGTASSRARATSS